ncbi:MOSC domain-containing protein [Streptomyces stramineus]
MLVTLPGQAELSVDDPELTTRLSDWLDRKAELVQPVAGMSAVFEKPDPEDESLAKDLSTQPGLFFDTKSTLHVLTTSSLRAARLLHPDGDWDVRRFRPNIVVRTVGHGYPEESWTGRTIRIGDATAWVRKPTPRCAMTTREQRGLPADREIHRVLARHRKNVLGALVHPEGTARLLVGDPVVA